MKIIRNESGQSLVLVAVFMGLLALGFLAIAVDAGMLFRQKRMAQNAADAVSIAAAQEVAAGTSSNEQNVANQVAKLNGFDTTLATNPAKVQLATPASGNFTGSTYVQATVSMPIHTVFLGAFAPKMANFTVAAQSTAGQSPSPTCVCLEASSTQALTMSNGSKLSALSCGIVNDSSSSQAIGMTGGSTLSALSLGTVSATWDTSQNINNGASISASTKIVQGLASGCSPAMPAAPSYSNCLADPGGAYGTFTVGPLVAGGTICYKSLTVGANGSTMTLNPGIYVISSGNLHFESGANGHSNLGGDGVFFYMLSGGSIVVDNGANINLVAGGNTESGGATAPGTGAYNGILVYQPAGNTTALTMAGGSSAYLNGAVYVPGAQLTLNNGSNTNFAMSLVAQTLNMSGGGTLTATSSSSGSTSVKLVQ